jgi:acyl-CoA dehydrogenase
VIDFEPTEEQALIVETVRQFAANEIRPRAREADEAGKLPEAVFGAAHELGLVANALPEAFGGGGERSALTGALIAEELAWGDLAIALAILSPALAAFPLADFGTDAQKKERLAKYAGPQYRPGSLALTEPHFGADAFRPQTTAKKTGGDYVLEGAKCQVPWQDGDDVVLISAADGGTAQLFLVPRSASGLKVERERNLGLSALPTAELRLEGVRVPAAARLVGLARASFEIARDYAKERSTFGAPIATRQAIAFKLADMSIEIDGARLLAWEAAWRLDRGEDALREATLAYEQVKRVALVVADGAVQVFGGHGYTREYLPEQHLRNARGYASFEALALV